MGSTGVRSGPRHLFSCVLETRTCRVWEWPHLWDSKSETQSTDGAGQGVQPCNQSGGQLEAGTMHAGAAIQHSLRGSRSTWMPPHSSLCQAMLITCSRLHPLHPSSACWMSEGLSDADPDLVWTAGLSLRSCSSA